MSKPTVTLEWMDADDLDERYDDFEHVIRKAFDGAEFTSPGYSVTGVVENCLVMARSHPERRTLVALGPNQEILGAVFHVPMGKKQNPEFGWFFTSAEIEKTQRTEIANRLIERVHEKMKENYQHIITTIGTRAGERFLSKHHGYRKLGTIKAEKGSIGGERTSWVKRL